MTEKKLVEFSKGEADMDLSFKDGKIRMSVSYDGKGVDAGIYVDVDPEYFLDKLKEAIPGTLDDKIIDMLKLAFKMSR